MFECRCLTQSFATGLVSVLALAATSLPAHAWPQRTVRFVVPVGTGTAPDITARLFAERLSDRWKQPVIVENRPGADGITGVAAYVGLRDDHALLFSFAAPLSVFPVIRDKLPYDPNRDIVPIAAAADTFAAIAASSSLKAGSLAEFVTLARAQPGKLNCFPAAGALPYLFTGFVKSAGLSVATVPYREQNLAVQDLAEGRLQCILSTITTTLPAVQSGKARLLAVTNSKRAPIAPDVPTATEAGFPQLHFEGLLGLFGSREMPADLRDRIAADVRAVAAEPAITARLAAIAQAPRGSTPAEFAASIDEQRAKMEAIVRLIGKHLGQ
jgi:tripartite-type tricarboxylate transporter receptor subunit TctC